jgi:hypothetical protein
MIGASNNDEVMHVLAQVPPASGALIRERTDGSMAGALLIDHGRVCWAMSQRYSRRLPDLLVAEQHSLSRAALAAVIGQCAREHKPFAETLLATGLVSLSVLYRALLRHTCEALDCLVRDDASPWAWIAHANYGYHPMLTFSPAEVIAGVRAIDNPELAARAQRAIGAVVRWRGATGTLPIPIPQPTDRNPGELMATTKETLNKLMEIEGIIGACIVDSNSGMMLGSSGGGQSLNLELAAAGNTEVVRAKRKTMRALSLNDPIEDILITLGRQYHLLRPLSSNDALFIYVALDRSRANLALARHYLAQYEKELSV